MNETMKMLAIEWRHYEKDGKTCDRSATTGRNLQIVVAELANKLKQEGVEVRFKEIVLTEADLSQSNMIRFNGVPMEELLSGSWVAENACTSCSCLVGEDVTCRAVEYAGEIFEDIPAELIRKIAYKVLGLPGNAEITD